MSRSRTRIPSPPAAGGGTRRVRRLVRGPRPGASPNPAASTSWAGAAAWRTTGTPVSRSTGERDTGDLEQLVIHHYCRGSTNMDLSRDEEGATQDRSNAPITTTHDPEQVRCWWEAGVTFLVRKPLSMTDFLPNVSFWCCCFQVSETKCCCFFKRKMRKKKTGRSKWPPGFGKIQKFLSRGCESGGDSCGEGGAGGVAGRLTRRKQCEELELLKSDKTENV